MGGEYRFGCRLEGLDIADGQIRGVKTSSGFIPTRAVLLAIGHSARDTYQMLYDAGVPLSAKAFQLGLRIEHPQEEVNQQKYGRPEYVNLLGAADYSLVARAAARHLYVLHVRRRNGHPERFRAVNVLHQRHEQFPARYAVCQQWNCGDPFSR